MFQFRRNTRRISALLAGTMLLAQLNVLAMAACTSSSSMDAGGLQRKCGTGQCTTESCCCSRLKAAQAEQPSSEGRSCCSKQASPIEQISLEATAGQAIDSAQPRQCHCSEKAPAPLGTARRAFQTDSIRLLAFVLAHESAVIVEGRFFSSWPIDMPGTRHMPVSVQQLYCCWLV